MIQNRRLAYRLIACSCPLLVLSMMVAACGPETPQERVQQAVQPLVGIEQQKLLSNDEGFGFSVALSGDTALVGAPLADLNGFIDWGSAYVFVRNGTSWITQAILKANDFLAGGGFGTSVSLSGDTAIVGASRTNNQQGSAYVFVRNGSTWIEQAKLVASDGATGDSFGWSVALSGDTAVVGADGDDVGANQGQGSAYVFVRNGTTWTEQAKLVASDGAVGDGFGYRVALSADTIIVGADQDTVGANVSQGSAYVFVRNGTTWTEQAKLVASDGAADDWFGRAATLSGDTAIVGSYFSDVGANVDQGAAYVFVRNGTTWTEQAKLVASDGAAHDLFGRSISLSGDTAAVGALYDDIGAIANQGSAYVFTRNGASWTEQAKLVATDGTSFDNFGYSVSLSGDTAIVGADYNNSAYLFVLRQANGDGCTTATECVSGFCVDGVCCNSACGEGDLTDCQACSVVAGAGVNGTCAPIAAGFECRASVGACDVAESCNGVTNDCPTDKYAVDGAACPDGTCASGICMGQGGAGGSGGSDGSSSSSSSSSSGGGNNPSEEGGCACRIDASSSSSSLARIALAALAVVLIRRRRARA